MAADKAVLASGADQGEGLRLRQVASQAAPVPIAQPEDKKKLAKKVYD